MVRVFTMRRGRKEVAAWQRLYDLRWGDEGAACPRCEARCPYWVRTRRLFKCAVPWCGYQFSVTTGTIFQYHKLSLTQAVKAVELYDQYGEHINVSEFSRQLGVNVKSAAVLRRKLRSGWIENGMPERVEHLVGYWQGR